ncbi:MAG: hypothetical protein JWQ98_3524 [Chlorobi bacterium]|nr:hypothetical protein [Chlorobiota bacterium]
MKAESTFGKSWRNAGRACAFAGLVALTAVIGSGCSSDPVAPSSSSFPVGVALQVGKTDKVVDSSGVHGSLEVKEGETIDSIHLQFIAKGSLARGAATGVTPKVTFTVADSSIAAVDGLSTTDFRLRGKKAGTTTLVIKQYSSDTVVYTSAAIPITVVSTVTSFKLGDTITYDYYDRDSTNTRMQDSKRKQTWTVAETGLSFQGKTNVTKVIEVNYTTSGASEFSRDTIYLQKGDDGSVYEYDLIHKMILHVQGGDAFAAAVTPRWVRMTSTSQSSATWSGIEGDSIALTNVPIAGVGNIDLLMRLAVSHKGTQSATVPAGTYGDATHTDHSLKIDAKVTGLGLKVLSDSLAGHIDYSAKDGVLRQSLESRMLVASVFGTSYILTVDGYDMELVSVKHK